MSWEDYKIERQAYLDKVEKPTVNSALHAMPSLPQRQDSTADQLYDLLPFAAKLGMYDACDTIKNILVSCGRIVR